jgi:hypothetical protein
MANLTTIPILGLNSLGEVPVGETIFCRRNTVIINNRYAAKVV